MQTVHDFTFSQNGNHQNDRYDLKRLDLAALLAAPAQPIAWRVRGLVADGTLTMLSAEAGVGKSWFAQALCLSVERGKSVLGLECAQGRTLYVDAEMGPQMFVDHRLRPAGLTKDDIVPEYIDAMGLDFSRVDDLAWLKSQILEIPAKLVILDSLRRLTPSKSENDSDDMAPVVAGFAKLARDTGAAILLIHHKGDGDKFYRGSSAIRDQTDALFGLLRADEEDDDCPVRRLTCRGARGKMPRYADEEPQDIYLMVSPKHGGVVLTDPPERTASEGRSVVSDLVKREILDAMPAKTKVAAAAKIGRRPDDLTFRSAWALLVDEELIEKHGGGWRKKVVVPDPLLPDPYHHFSCVCETPDELTTDGRCSRCFGAIEEES